jgi:hypothetical protein
MSHRVATIRNILQANGSRYSVLRKTDLNEQQFEHTTPFFSPFIENFLT